MRFSPSLAGANAPPREPDTDLALRRAVYKYWDDLTREDLEFSVGSKTATWELREGLLDEDDRSYGQGAYPPQKGYSSYGY